MNRVEVTASGGQHNWPNCVRSNASMGKDIFSKPVECEAAGAFIAAQNAVVWGREQGRSCFKPTYLGVFITTACDILKPTTYVETEILSK